MIWTVAYALGLITPFAALFVFILLTEEDREREADPDAFTGCADDQWLEGVSIEALRAASGMEARQGGDANAAPSSDDSPAPSEETPK